VIARDRAIGGRKDFTADERGSEKGRGIFTTETRRHGEEQNKDLTLISRITRIVLAVSAIFASSANLAILLIRAHPR